MAPTEVTRRLAWVVLFKAKSRSEYALLAGVGVLWSRDAAMAERKHWILVAMAVRIGYHGSRKASLCAAGDAAAVGGRWDEAVVRVQSVIAEDPGYGDVQDRLAEALDNGVACVPGGEFVIGSDAGDTDERPHRLV